MNTISFFRGSARMLQLHFVGTILASGLALSAQARVGVVGNPPGLPVPHRFVPYISGINDGFAYKVNTNSNQQDVYLAQMVAVTPYPFAQAAGLLQSYVSDSANSVNVNRMKASLANDRLLVQYTIQGSGFTDIDLDFFDMQTGANQGFINELAFALFNSSIQPSQRLAELKVKWVQMNYVTPAQAAAFDYSLNPEDYGVFDVTAQWNSDGTATIFFHTTVFLANAPGYNGTPIGTETFAINLAYSSLTQKMEIVDYGNGHTAATYPTVFNVSIQGGGASGQILFQGTPILVQDSYWQFGSFGRVGGVVTYYYYPTASLIEAEIPSVYYLY
jgi:hypothetical protein